MCDHLPELVQRRAFPQERDQAIRDACGAREGELRCDDARLVLRGQPFQEERESVPDHGAVPLVGRRYELFGRRFRQPAQGVPAASRRVLAHASSRGEYTTNDRSVRRQAFSVLRISGHAPFEPLASAMKATDRIGDPYVLHGRAPVNHHLRRPYDHGERTRPRFRDVEPLTVKDEA
jgi:hypothetical protein